MPEGHRGLWGLLAGIRMQKLAGVPWVQDPRTSPQDDLCHLCHRVTQVPSGLALPSPEIAMTLKKPHKADSMLYGMIILPQVSPGSKCWGWEPRAPPQPRWLPSGASLFPPLSQYNAQREGRALEVCDHRSHPCIRLPCPLGPFYLLPSGRISDVLLTLLTISSAPDCCFSLRFIPAISETFWQTEELNTFSVLLFWAKSAPGTSCWDSIRLKHMELHFVRVKTHRISVLSCGSIWLTVQETLGKPDKPRNTSITLFREITWIINILKKYLFVSFIHSSIPRNL